MFNNDKLSEDNIKKLIDSIEDGKHVIPIYIKNFNKEYYPLIDINSISSYDRYMKIGFGCKNNILNKNSFPVNELGRFDDVNFFIREDIIKGEVRYFTFETSIIVDTDGNKSIIDEINEYISMIDEYVQNMCEKKRTDLINEQIKQGMYIDK